MTAPTPARIFISYATRDGAEAAAKLRLDLEAQGFSIWQDIVALQGNTDWWSQIENALRSKELQHFILVVTPGALESPVVRREIRLARQEGKTVSPVRGPSIENMAAIPRWLGNLYDLDVAERRTNLLRVLESPGTAKRVPMMAPEPPFDFVARPVEFDALKKLLLDPMGDAVAITAALRGAGGYGKTTLAKALAHDSDIQDAYFDGVLWVELGEQGGGRMLSLIADLVALVTGEARTMTTIEAARTALAEALGDRRILLVVDDVWQKHYLDPFLQGGKNTTRLVTTRFDKELPETAVRQAVDAMRADEALRLMAWGLPDDQATPLAAELGDLAQRLYDWAQLLKLANGFLRDRVGKFNQPLGRAIDEAKARLAAKGLPAFDDPKAKGHEGRHKSVAAAIGINLDLLNEDKRAKFGQFGIFPEDADIPIGIVARLWAPAGESADHFATLDLLTELYDLSLLLSFDLDHRTIRFHDTTRHYLQHTAGKTGLSAQHRRLVEAIGDMGGASDTSPADTEYFYRFLPYHLAGAGDRAKLDALLLDPGWLQAKLVATASPQALVADYDQHGQGHMQNYIGRTLRLTTGILSRNNCQLMPQLLGRLMAYADPAAPAFLKSARRLVRAPALLPTLPSLTPPGAQIARLEGHTGSVGVLAVLPDGRLASGSDDNTIRLWDPATTFELARLEGHTHRVTALAVLIDGRLASCSIDRTIRLWDVSGESAAAGAETACIKCYSSIYALAVLPDGRLASGSDDGDIQLWDPKSGAATALISVSTEAVHALAVLHDGWLAAASVFDSICLWDPGSMSGASRSAGAKPNYINGSAAGNCSWVRALAVLADGRLASGLHDGTILLRAPGSGAFISALQSTMKDVTALAALPDGRLASSSSDGSIRLWDPGSTSGESPASGPNVVWTAGRAGPVRALAALPNGRLASSSSDGNIRLWDPGAEFGASPVTSAEIVYVKGHAGPVTALAVLPDGRPVSGSGDCTIRVWDQGAMSSVCVAARNEKNNQRLGVTALAVLHDGRIASSWSDGTIKLSDPGSGATIAAFMEGISWRHAMAVLPDGRLALGSDEGTVRLYHPGFLYQVSTMWRAETARLDGHRRPVRALVALPDGRLASGSDDNTIRLWDLDTCVETTRLEGHTGGVYALTLLSDGRMASGSDDKTIRLWYLGSMFGGSPTSVAETSRLKGHMSSVNALAVMPDGRLASGSADNTIRLWNPATGHQLCLLEVDAPVLCLAALPDCRLVAGDEIGLLHWLEIVD